MNELEKLPPTLEIEKIQRISKRLKFKSMTSAILLRLTRSCQLVAVAPTMIEEVNIRALSALDTKLGFIKVLGATTKHIRTRADALLVHRAAEVATAAPTRR